MSIYIRLMGWTFTQWAEAAGYAARFIGDAPPNMDGAQRVRHVWLLNRADQPGGLRLLDAVPDMRWGWAADMMASVYGEIGKWYQA